MTSRYTFARPDSFIGMRWFGDADSVVLEVPSAVVPMQKNHLINPQHPHFGELPIGSPGSFDTDPRLAC